MSNTLATANANPFANYERDQATHRHFPGDLMKFNKGDYLAGKDGDPLPIGTQFVAVMNSYTRGWQRWENGELTDARLGFYVKGFKPPRRSELGDRDENLWQMGKDGKPRDPWSYINALCLVSPETMKICTFITGTDGGLRAVNDLADDHGATPSGKYPIVALEADSYMHPDRAIGRVKFPVLRIVGQVDAAPYDRAVAKARGNRAPPTEMPEALPTQYPAERLGHLKPADDVYVADDGYAGHPVDDDLPL
jgi:hypothetical protein